MSYLKMLGLGARARPGAAAGLFSTAVISGSSSAPNLRVMVPAAAATNTALEGFGGVPAIRPLETLHNALSLRQLDAFLERVTAAPVLLGTPPANNATPNAKRQSPTNSAGWSGPSSLMSSSGELQSGVSSAGPSSPTSAHHDPARLADSNWSRNAPSKLPQWDGEAATLCAYDATLHPFMPHASAPGSCISGDVTPVSAASELEFNSNEATAGSGTDHELPSGEGEDDEDTLSVDPCSSPMRVIKNDLSHSSAITMKLDRHLEPSTSSSCQAHASSSADLYGLSLQQTKENFYKDMPSSSKNYYNNESDAKNKCTKSERPTQWSNLDSLNLQGKENKSAILRNDILNNGSRRYSDSSAQKSNHNSNPPTSRFTTTLVDEDKFRASTMNDSKSNNNVAEVDGVPVVTRAKNCNVKPGFKINDL